MYIVINTSEYSQGDDGDLVDSRIEQSQLHRIPLVSQGISKANVGAYRIVNRVDVQ